MEVNSYIFNSKKVRNKHWQYLILLLMFIIAFDFLFGKLYEGLYFSEKSTNNDPLIHSVLGTNEDILIFGSSRAMHHYNPKILEDSLNMTAYNMGSGGQNIYFHLALLEAALERYTPKIVILDLMSIDFEVTPPEWDTEKLSILLPFYHSSTAAKKAILRRGMNEKIKTISFIYPYNSLQNKMLKYNFFKSDDRMNGFYPLTRVHNNKLEKVTINEGLLDSNKVETIFKFIELCQKNQIKLFIFNSPSFIHQIGSNQFENLNIHLKMKFGIPIFDFESNKDFLAKSDFFADPSHLNTKGADYYTRKVAKLLKSKANYKGGDLEY